MKQTAYTYIGKDIERVDIRNKAYGKAKFTNDSVKVGELQIALHTSEKAHANFTIHQLETALQAPGVHAIITGEDFPYPVGPLIADRPPLAYKKVRYYGEPIAAVIADYADQAKYAANLLDVHYEELPIPTRSGKSRYPLFMKS